MLIPPSHPPGEFFWHNNWDFNILGMIFEQETVKKIRPKKARK